MARLHLRLSPVSTVVKLVFPYLLVVHDQFQERSSNAFSRIIRGCHVRCVEEYRLSLRIVRLVEIVGLITCKR